MDGKRIRNHMEVLGSDGAHVGTVDHTDDGSTIKLTRKDPTAGNSHHWIPQGWVEAIEGDKLRLSMTATEARQRWRNDKPAGP